MNNEQNTLHEYIKANAVLEFKSHFAHKRLAKFLGIKIDDDVSIWNKAMQKWVDAVNLFNSSRKTKAFLEDMAKNLGITGKTDLKARIKAKFVAYSELAFQAKFFEDLIYVLSQDPFKANEEEFLELLGCLKRA